MKRVTYEKACELSFEFAGDLVKLDPVSKEGKRARKIFREKLAAVGWSTEKLCREGQKRMRARLEALKRR